MTTAASIPWQCEAFRTSSQDSVDIHLSFGPSDGSSDHGGETGKPCKGLLCHPYVHSTGAEVNIFNCVAIFMAYCKALLGDDEFNRMQLFQFHRPPGQQVDQLYALCYPSPEGKVYVTAKQVDDVWGGKGLADIVHRRQISSLRDIDRQKILFVYPVVLDMIRRGFLDEYNKPAATLLPASTTSGLATQLALPAVPPAAAPTQRTRGRPSGKKEGSKWPQNKDPKSLLNELKHQMGMELVYETLPVWPQVEAPRFQSTLQVKYQQEVHAFRGNQTNSKKAAEQSAAVLATNFILSGGLEETTSLPNPEGQPVSAPPAQLPTPLQGSAVLSSAGKPVIGSGLLTELAPRSPQSLLPGDRAGKPSPPTPTSNLRIPCWPPMSNTSGANVPLEAVAPQAGQDFHGEAIVYLMPSSLANSWPSCPPAPAIGLVGDASSPRGPAATLTKGWQFAAAWFTPQNLLGPAGVAEEYC